MRIHFLALILVWGSTCFAEVTVFDVRQSIAMSDDDKTYRDFYLNGGSEAGLKPGQIVTLQRRSPLYDSYSNHAAGELQLLVAKVKIIHAQKGLAVARLHAELVRDEIPFLEENYIMVGDVVDVRSATAENVSQPADITVIAQESRPRILINSVELPLVPSAIDAGISEVQITQDQ